jgi:thiol-disulfide isomerase/thioredoxin
MRFMRSLLAFVAITAFASSLYPNRASAQFLMPNPRAVAKGKPVPEFSVKLMNTGETVSNTSLKGKTYMIDFWAVWCGPCRGELPGLHAAYEKFKSKITVLSLSFDRTPTDVEKFRANPATPMPWLHTFVEKGFESDLAKTFEVRGIPKPILVDANGIIAATDSELRGENLQKTLARVVGDVNAGVQK